MKWPARARACGAEFAPRPPYANFSLNPVGFCRPHYFSRNFAEPGPAAWASCYHMQNFWELCSALQKHQCYSDCLFSKQNPSPMNVCSFDKIFNLCYNIKKRIMAGRVSKSKRRMNLRERPGPIPGRRPICRIFSRFAGRTIDFLKKLLYNIYRK